MYKKASLSDVQRQPACNNLIAFATENYCNHILLPYSYSLYEPKSHALMEYNGGLEKAILRDSELLSEVNDAVVLLPSESYSKSQQLYNYQQTAIKGQS